MSNTIANQLFLAYMGRPADAAWRSSTANLLNGNQPSAALQTAFYNAAISEGVFATTDSNSTLVNKIFLNLFGVAATTFEQTAWSNLITNGTLTTGTLAWGIFAGYFGATNVPDQYKLPTQSKLTAVEAYTSQLTNDGAANLALSQGGAAAASARAQIATVISQATAATFVTNIASNVSSSSVSSGSTFTLTTGVDSFTGTANNDTFTGFAGTGATTSAADSVAGGAGIDTFRLFTDGAVVIPGTFTSIENLLINDTVHQSTDLTSGVLLAGGVQNLTFQSGTTVDGATVTATLGSGHTLTLDTVTDGDATAATVADGGISIAQAAALTTTALTLNNVGAATANTALTIGLAGTGVTTANVTVTGANHVNLLNAGGAQTTLNISGAGTLTTYTDLATTVTTVNGSTATGVLSLDLAGTSVRTVTGGTAADIFRLGSGYIGGSSGATRDIIDGGAGRDTLSITVARALDSVATTAQSNLTSIEILTISDAWTGGNIDLTKFTGIDTVILAAAATGTNSMTVNSGTAVTLGVDTANDAVSTFIVGGVGVTDTMTLNMAGFDFLAGGTAAVATTGIETLNITTGTTVTDAATISGTTTMTVSAGSTGGVINVSGANAMTFTGVVTAAAINASSLTGILTVTAAAANAISITGGTAADVINGSAVADLITGGNGADTITGAAGNDSIVLTETTAAVDKVVFSGGGSANATAAQTLTANGMDTITGFGATDTLNIAALGDGTTSATGLTTINAAAAQGATTDDTVVILNVAATAGALTTGGTATVTDFTNMTQVAAFLSERFTHTATTANVETVFVWNVGTTTYIYNFDSANTANSSIDAGEIVLVGQVIQGAALTSANLVYA